MPFPSASHSPHSLRYGGSPADALLLCQCLAGSPHEVFVANAPVFLIAWSLLIALAPLALALRSIVPVRTFLLLYGGLPADELLVELCSGALAPFRSLDQVLVVAC